MSTRRALQDLSDAEIRRLVDSLNSLREGELGVTVLAACGVRAIGPLREFLLNGRPTTVAEPRQRAVRALAELGAKDVLLEYLRAPRHIPDAAVRFTEEAVENTAARTLGRWQTEDVFQGLLDIASSRALAGVIESLGQFKRVEAIPHFIFALGNDFAYRAAEDALSKLGQTAVAALIEAARAPDPSRQSESPTSILQRRRAVRILADTPLSREVWTKLQPLLWESDHQIAVAAARIALCIAPECDHAKAATRLIEALDHVDWLTTMDIEDTLAEHYEELQKVIEAALEERTVNVSQQTRGQDAAIRTLTRARQRAFTTKAG